MRDTGMRNERELFRMRIENLDWQKRVIFVPDSKTAEGRRLVPMSGRVFEILRISCDARQEGWVFTNDWQRADLSRCLRDCLQRPQSWRYLNESIATAKQLSQIASEAYGARHIDRVADPKRFKASPGWKRANHLRERNGALP